MEEAFLLRKPPRTLEVAVKALAVLGGVIALAVAVVVALSVLSRWLFSSPIPGDFELAQIGTASAVFAFLPYCQLVRGNIVVDTFTSRLPKRTLRGILQVAAKSSQRESYRRWRQGGPSGSST